jgi:hypothetical protein
VSAPIRGWPHSLSNVPCATEQITRRPWPSQFYRELRLGHVTTDIEAETAQARASTIDMLVSSLDIQRVEFVKIDAEGSEWAILKGAADTVKRFQPLIRVRWKMKKILRLCPGRLVSRGPRKRARSGRARTNLAAICRCFPAVRRGREPGWRVIHVQSLRRYDAALDTKRTGATKNRLQT